MNIMFNQLETKDPEGFLSLYQVKRDKMDQFLKLLQLFQVYWLNAGKKGRICWIYHAWLAMWSVLLKNEFKVKLTS